MGGIFGDCQVVVTKNKESPDFHAPGLRLMTIDVATIEGMTRKGFSR